MKRRKMQIVFKGAYLAIRSITTEYIMFYPPKNKNNMSEKLDQLKTKQFELLDKILSLSNTNKEELVSYLSVIFPNVPGCRFEVSLSENFEAKLYSGNKILGSLNFRVFLNENDYPVEIRFRINMGGISAEKEEEFLGLKYIGGIANNFAYFEKENEERVLEILQKYYPERNSLLKELHLVKAELDVEKESVSDMLANHAIEYMGNLPFIIKDFTDQFPSKFGDYGILRMYYLNEKNRIDRVCLKNVSDLVYIKIIDKIDGFFKLEFKLTSGEVINSYFVKQKDLLAGLKGIVYNGI